MTRTVTDILLKDLLFSVCLSISYGFLQKTVISSKLVQIFYRSMTCAAGDVTVRSKKSKFNVSHKVILEKVFHFHHCVFAAQRSLRRHLLRECLSVSLSHS